MGRMARSTGILAILLAGLLAGCNGDITGGDGDGDGDGDGGGDGDGDAGQGAPDSSADTTDLMFCVEETNRYRAMDGRPPLAHSQAIEDYAMVGAQQDTEQGQAHYHFSSTNGGGIAFAENECPSFLGWTVMGTVRNTIAECIAAFYSEGPGGGHYDNMMGNYGSCGCGVYLTGTGGITIVQDLGN